MSANVSPIPQPPTVPFLGNAPLIEQDVPLRSFTLLAQQYGEIFQLVMPGGRVVIHCTSYALVRQLSDDKRFKKPVTGSLRELRRLVGDGLFTAELEEPNWAIAHRVLMPTFSTMNVKGMFDDMKDICSQMILKWERFGPDHVFEPTEDYTRLTLDTIALCAMSLRFNSFYSPTMPPFVQAMFDVLLESGKRALRPALISSLPLLFRATNEKYEKDVKFLTDQAREILENRKAHPIEKKDLLALMLTGKDPKTGQLMSEDSIIYNLITFLIAGHETTSGMLSFTTYYLLKNAEAMQKLREEIDAVCGDQDVTLDDLAKMPYLLAVMRESMRLSPTAPMRAVVPIQSEAEGPTTLVGGDGDASNPNNKRYLVPPGTPIAVSSGLMMRDVRVWGEDAESFRPERMLADAEGKGGFAALPPQAWQPFGFGLRACIGRPFAWQEAQLVLASVFQKFDLFLADPSYTLQIKQALTIKPKGLMVRAVPRQRAGISRSPSPSPSMNIGPLPTIPSGAGQKAILRAESGQSVPKKTVHVLYGSNTGTCEGLAQRVVSDAASRGFAATMSTLDSAAGRLPKDVKGPVVIITASFEGEPADNATHFVQWLQSLSSSSSLTPSSSLPLSSTAFAVFGCGNREWASTYQRIPRLVDELLEKGGAARVAPRGEADVSGAGFFEDWEKWEEGMWRVFGERYGVAKDDNVSEEMDSLQVDVVDAGTTRARLLRQPEAGIGRVIENRVLTREGTPMKRHIEIELPDGMTYRAGDYLAILPTNPSETVERVIKRLALDRTAEVVINSSIPTTFPTNVPLAITDLLGGYVELSQPATTRDLQTIIDITDNATIRCALSDLRSNYHEEVLSKRLSVLDILEDHPELRITFATFLRLLPPMRVRQYSISSSPLVAPQRASLTVSVVDAPALSRATRRYLGVASNCLSRLTPVDRLPVVVRPSGAAFHLPNDPAVPVVMFCAGSGLAPFRGFVMERASQKASGREVGRMLLFFGCRAPGDDYLYVEGAGAGAEERVLKKWAEEGVVDLRPAFSRKTDESKGCKYVQDRVLHDRDDIIELYHAGAKFYSCGSRNAANGIKQACISIIKHDNPGMTDDDAARAFEKVQKERYATDIFD